MKIKSPVFINREEIPYRYACDGDNISPPLSFKDVPGSAKSLALVVEDPDAPRGTFTHWVVWNIKPGTEKVGEATLPEGAIEGMTSAGNTGYVGPCPPRGTHRYFFRLYALSKVLDIGNESDVVAFTSASKNFVIDKAELMGVYSR